MLKWTFRGGYDGHEWNASETEKWYYSIALKCDETGNVSFVADRMSTNDGLAHEDIGDLQQESATLEEAKRTGTLSVTQTMTPSLTNMEATLLHGSNLRPRNGLASLSAGRVASRSPTVTGSRGFSITDATLNARPALNKQSGKSEWI